MSDAPGTPPTVSVVVINYNTPELTTTSVDSVLERTRGVSVEVIVVDNGSTDAMPEPPSRWEASVRMVRSPTNLGFAGGNNLGIRHARGLHILLLNSDTVLRNDAISIALDALREEERVGVVSSKLLSPDGTLQFPCRRFPGILRELAEAARLHRLLPSGLRGRWLQGSYYHHQDRLETDSVWGTFFLFSRGVLRCFPDGRLTETFFMYGEDMEWSWIVRRCGYRILYVPEAEVLHYGGGSGFDEATEASGGTAAAIYRHRAHFLLRYKGRFFAWGWALAHMLNVFLSRGRHRKARLRAAAAMFAVLRGGRAAADAEHAGGGAHV